MTAQKKHTYTLAELAEHVGGQAGGQGNAAEVKISGVGTLAGSESHQISFLTNVKYKSQLAETKAGAVIIHDKAADECPVPALIHDNPHRAVVRYHASCRFRYRRLGGSGVVCHLGHQCVIGS